jgi:uncharacterized membrane protein
LICVEFGGGAAAYVNGIHGREHTWISASRWIYQNAPGGSVLLWELWDDQLPKSLPEPGMDMGSAGLRNIDWSPYEEDTAEKYALLKQKLNEADFVVYSSKRIYDSVDELPERYPMTNLYYEAMWDGRLGFELAAEFTSPPRLFGWIVEDRHADESWSLYDHPQVSVFRKVRQLSDAEYDALFGRVWEEAVPYYRGKDSPISPFLQLLGLGSQPGSERQGLIGALVSMLSRGESQPTTASPQNKSDLLFDEPLANLPLVDNYRWNVWASEQTLLSVLVWWLVVAMLGWFAWPLCFALFAPFLDRGYLFSRTMGWLMAGWLLWLLASVNMLHNTVTNSWLMAGVVGLVGAGLAWRQRQTMLDFLAARWKLLLVEEALVAAAFGFFIFIRLVNPDIWQPWYGGEKFMEFAFLNGILRSPTFPPVDPHFAGGYINYYYFGIYLVGYLIKLTGIYAEVAFNLTIPLLFALAVANAFAVTHTAWGVWQGKSAWQRGVLPALLGPFLVTLIGNLDGYAQIVRQLSDRSPVQLQSALPGVTWLVEGIGGLIQVATGQSSLPVYDFWAPSRVIPATINEFPYWSFLFADLHPHLIGIPLSLFFLGALFSLLIQYAEFWNGARQQGIALITALAFLLGGLISVNLWELPTYFGLAILTLLVGEFRYFGHARLLRVGMIAITLLAVALLFYLPFFLNFVNVGASGVGLVREGDDLGLWLLLWGGLGFVVISWLAWRIYGAGLPVAPRMPRSGSEVALPSELVGTSSATEAIDELDYDDGGWDDPSGLAEEDAEEDGERVREKRTYRPQPPGRVGVPRVVGQSLRRFERLPRLWYLHQLLVQRPTLSYLLGLAAIPLMLGLAVAAWLLDRTVLALCLAVLAVALPLLWRREREADASDQLATMLAITGVLLLGGTQIFYLKDFLQGSDYYRMNTLFKFFNQVWVLWAVAGAIALPRLWAAARRKQDPIAAAVGREEALGELPVLEGMGDTQTLSPAPITHPLSRSDWRWGGLWRLATVLVLAACTVFVIFGTPSRLSQRFVGWVPPFGTLNGMDYMQHGQYAWPNDGHWIDLSYDYSAIKWLLENVRGNLVIAESAEVDYYRAGGTRVASMTGLSGLRGSHVSEQRYGEHVGMRDGLHREFWATTSVERTQELIGELEIALIYVGQLERFHHPEGVQKLVKMASEGRLVVLYENEGVVIYAVPDRVVLSGDGKYHPVPVRARLPVPSMGWRVPRLLAVTKS